MKPIGQFRQAHHFSTILIGEFFTAVHAAIGDGHAAWVFGRKVGHHQLNHFASAHKQNFDFGEVFKNLTCQANRCGRHADGMGANFSGRSHLFGDCKTALKQLVQGAAQGAGLFCGSDRIFELTQNLRFAQDHGVETAGHSEGMSGHMAFFKHVGVGAQFLGRDTTGLSQPIERFINHKLICGTINFCAVAS